MGKKVANPRTGVAVAGVALGCLLPLLLLLLPRSFCCTVACFLSSCFWLIDQLKGTQQQMHFLTDVWSAMWDVGMGHGEVHTVPKPSPALETVPMACCRQHVLVWFYVCVGSH